MPRQARLDVPGALHHIMVRGINKSAIFQDDQDKIRLLALVRYIHLNSIRTKIVQTMEQLDRYPWSGHRAFIGKVKHPWMDIDTVLSQFGRAKRKAIAKYRRFVREGMGEGRNLKLTGGGLIRSQGGWSQVLAMRRKDHKEESDERILGAGDFVHAILKEAEEKQLRQLKLRRGGRNIADIIRQECEKSKVSQEELKRGGRRTRVSEARAAIAHRSREELGLSGSDTS